MNSCLGCRGKEEPQDEASGLGSKCGVLCHKHSISMSLQMQLWCQEPGEQAGLGSIPGPSEASTGGADGAHGISRRHCKAVLAGGDVSKSICYQPWRRQTKISPARASMEREGACSVCPGCLHATGLHHSSPMSPLWAPTFKENWLNFVLMQSC